MKGQIVTCGNCRGTSQIEEPADIKNVWTDTRAATLWISVRCPHCSAFFNVYHKVAQPPAGPPRDIAHNPWALGWVWRLLLMIIFVVLWLLGIIDQFMLFVIHMF